MNKQKSFDFIEEEQIPSDVAMEAFFNKIEIDFLMLMIDETAKRGGFKGDELKDVGIMYQRLKDYNTLFHSSDLKEQS